MQARERQSALDLARRGDGPALGHLLDSFRLYIRAIVSALRDGRLAGRIDDSDLIQDALLEAHRAFVGFRGATVAEFAVWLRQIAVRTAGHTLRGLLGTGKRDPTREVTGDGLAGLVPDPGSSPSATAIRHEEMARLSDAMARLPVDMQHVLLDRHVDALPYATIAERLGRTEGAVRVLYVRAIDRLRTLVLTEDETGEEPFHDLRER